MAACPVFFFIWLLLAWQLPGDSLLFAELQNAGHAVGFAGLSLYLVLICDWLRAKRRGGGRRIAASYLFYVSLDDVYLCFKILLFSLLIGGLIEVGQSSIGRQMTWEDWYLDGLGALSGLVFFLYRYGQLSPELTRCGRLSLKAFLLVVSGVFLLLAFFKTVQAFMALGAREKMFPVLFDGEGYFADQLVEAKYQSGVTLVEAPQSWSGNRTIVAKLTVPALKSWPSLALREPVRNWENFESLYFEIYSEELDTQTVILRINDTRHNNRGSDRFNRQLKIKAGLNLFNIPMKDIAQSLQGRRFDLQNIDKVFWYFDEPSSAHVIYFDNIELRPKNHD